MIHSHIYEEKFNSWQHSALLLVVGFMVIFSPWDLGSRELYWSESKHAVMAKEIDHIPPLTLAHGELLANSFPLFPLLASILHRLGVGMEFALRAVSIGSLGLIVILVWEAGRRAADMRAAIVSAAVMMSSICVVSKVIDGYPEFTALLFLSLGWLVWFRYGLERGNWNFAWLSGMFFCGLAFYTIGWWAVVLYFFPLLFMRRPLAIWPKLRKPGFLLGVGVLLTIVLVWGWPRWTAGTDIPFRSLPLNTAAFGGYPRHLLTFPLEVAWRFLPWSLLAWAPFCVAFQPLEKNPIFSRFLRTIFLATFFLLWVSPLTRSRDIVFLAPPLALLVGDNYWIVVRRYGYQLHKVFNWCSRGWALAAVAVFLFFLVPSQWWEWVEMPPQVVEMVNLDWRESLIKTGAALCICLYLIFSIPPYLKVFEHAFLLVMAVALVFWSTSNPLKVQEKFAPDSKTTVGGMMREAIGEDFRPDMTVYLDRRIDGLYGVPYYLGARTRRVHSYEELPVEQPTIYLISTDLPMFPQRSWTRLVEVEYDQRKLSLWRGQIRRP